MKSRLTCVATIAATALIALAALADQTGHIVPGDPSVHPEAGPEQHRPVPLFIGGAWIGLGFDAMTLVDADGDGIDDEADACPDSDLAETVVIDGCDTEVPNALDADGCTISDLIADCAASARNHGQFVKCVVKLAKDLQKDDLITKDDAKRLKKCAAHADIP